jgi:ABC-2 type transport system permease protein
MRLKENIIAYRYIVMHEAKRNFRLWIQILVPPLITASLYFLIFGQIIGSRVGQMNHVNYLDFIVPGIIMMNMIMASYNASVFVIYMAKFNKSIEALYTSPTAALTILFAFISVGVVRGFLIGLIVGIVAYFFTDFHIAHIGLMLLIALLGNTLFASLGMFNAFFAKNFDQVSMIPNFVITPLSYLGGIFYSVASLPPIWQKIALLNPLLYLITSFRDAFYDMPEINITLAVSIMILLSVILFAANFRLLTKRRGMHD